MPGILKIFAIFLIFDLGQLIFGEKLSDKCPQGLEENRTEFCKTILQMSRTAEMRNNMNEYANPCDDFYEFACGNFKKGNPTYIKTTTGLFENLNEGLTRKYKTVLKAPIRRNDTSYDKLVKNFYGSCLKLVNTTIEDHQNSYHRIIMEFGIMPLLAGEKWNENYTFNWIEVVGKMKQKYNIKAIIDVDIQADFKDNSINRIYFGQAELPLEKKSVYLNDDLSNYREWYVSQLKSKLTTHFKVSEEKAEKVAKEMLHFEQLLAEGLPDETESRSMEEIAELRTPKAITEYAPTFNVSRYLELVYNEPITDEIYDERDKKFLKQLEKVMNKVPQETVANYVFYRLVSEFFPRANMYISEQHNICTEIAQENFSKLLDNIVYRYYGLKAAEKDINDMWQKIKEAFKRKLNSTELEWISQEVRQHAQVKLAAMRLEINSHANTDFARDFDGLMMNDEDFIENLKNLYEHKSKKHIRKLHEEPSDISEDDVDLSYTPVNIIMENKIKIPVAILQPFYLWNKYLPEAFMYGTLGFLIGHELVHSFDDNGREYDEFGNQRDWWDANSTVKFNNRTECFMKQYHRYKFGDSFLPLTESQAENIADNGGLRIAYDAYINERKDVHEELKLFADYTPEKLFFISYAQVWCSETKASLINLQKATDEHTPGKFRVIGVLSNSEEFAKTFKCPADSYMNPKDKCVIY